MIAEPPPLPPPVVVYAATEATLIVAPEVVAAVGVVHPQTPLGKPPPMARSRMTDSGWSKACCQTAVPTWLSVTVKYAAPSRYQVIDSAAVLVRSRTIA
ncbi:hypothetical protein KAURM247S_08241 [Kitasatospora aureofaciens]